MQQFKFGFLISWPTEYNYLDVASIKCRSVTHKTSKAEKMKLDGRQLPPNLSNASLPMPLSSSAMLARKLSIKPEMHHIAIGHYIFFTF
jgi:hypothetical protein